MRAAKADNNLTPEQERYCKERAKGLHQAEAYAKAYKRSKATKKTQAEAACRMEANDKVMGRIRYYQQRAAEGAILDARGMQAIQAEMAQDDTRPDGVRLKAMDQLARLQGAYKDGIDVRTSGAIGVDVRRSALADVLPPPEE